MPDFDIIKKCSFGDSFRVSSIVNKFDLKKENIKEHFKGSIGLEDDWQIGLIVGASGTGKTTILNNVFKENVQTQKKYTNESVIDDMNSNKSVDEICRMFSNVGFSSPPSWIKPYSVLSNGEKMRVDLANSLLDENEITIFDEFTSVVDRNVAKVGSFAVQKAVRKTKNKFIAVGCHYDVEDWLMPDWVFYTDDMTFKKKSIKSQSLESKSMKQKKNQNIGICLVDTII